MAKVDSSLQADVRPGQELNCLVECVALGDGLLRMQAGTDRKLVASSHVGREPVSGRPGRELDR